MTDREKRLLALHRASRRASIGATEGPKRIALEQVFARHRAATRPPKQEGPAVIDKLDG